MSLFLRRRAAAAAAAAEAGGLEDRLLQLRRLLACEKLGSAAGTAAADDCGMRTLARTLFFVTLDEVDRGGGGRRDCGATVGRRHDGMCSTYVFSEGNRLLHPKHANSE